MILVDFSHQPSSLLFHCWILESKKLTEAILLVVVVRETLWLPKARACALNLIGDSEGDQDVIISRNNEAVWCVLKPSGGGD